MSRKGVRRHFISFRVTARERKQVQAFQRAGETVHQTARRLVLRASLPVVVSVAPEPAPPEVPGEYQRLGHS